MNPDFWRVDDALLSEDIDIAFPCADHVAMDTPTEKDYIDAKLQAVIERLNGEAKARQLATDARLDKLNQTIDAGLKSVRAESSTKYAQLEASFHRGQSEVIKWVVGAVLASTAVSVSTIAVLLVHSAPKPPATAPAPIVIYPQPAPPMPPAR